MKSILVPWVLVCLVLSAHASPSAQGRALGRKLSGPLNAAGDVSFFAYSPSGGRIVYRADASFDGVDELYSVRDRGQEPAFPLGLSVSVRGIWGLDPGFEISPGGRWVVSWSYGGLNYQVRSAELDRAGTARDLLVGTGITFAANDLRIAPQGDQVILRADLGGQRSLFARSLDGSGSPRRLTAPGHDVDGFQIAPGGQRIVYLAQRTLFSVDDSLVSVALTPAFPFDTHLCSNVISTEGRVVYDYYDDIGYGVWLDSVPIDGSAPPTTLDYTACGMDLHPAGPWLVYGAAAEIRSVPINGGTLNSLDWPVEEDMHVSPDGARLLYRAWRQTKFQLFEVPVNGSALPRRVNSDLVQGGNVALLAAYPFSPDGRFTVYTADAEVDGSVELYSVEGTAAPVRLSTHRPGITVDGRFAITPDGAEVVYRADQNTAGVIELYAVPIDGSAHPRRLNSPLVAGGDVSSFAIDPLGRTVAYRADQDEDEKIELYVSPLGPGYAGAPDPTRTVTR